MTENTLDLALQHQQYQQYHQRDELSTTMAVAGGALMFAVAGVVLTHVRRHRIKSTSEMAKVKAFDDGNDELDGDGEDDTGDGKSGSRVYALFS